MPPQSPTAREVARRLLARVGASGGPGHDLLVSAAVAEQAFRVLAGELSRWFGPYGYHALLTRALAETQGEHPALAAIHVRSTTEPWLNGLPEAAKGHGADAASDAVTALLAALIDLLSRLIGADLAVTLVSEAMAKRASDSRPDDVPHVGGVTDTGGAP